MSVSDGTHYRTYSHAVKAVIDEYKHTHEDRNDLGNLLILDMILSPSTKRPGSTGLVYDGCYPRQKNEEYEHGAMRFGCHRRNDSRLVAIADQSIKCHLQVEVTVQESSRNNADKKRRVNFLCYQSHGYRDQRRQKRQKCGIYIRSKFHKVLPFMYLRPAGQYIKYNLITGL